MKKRYIATPVLLLSIALTWNLILNPSPQPASAEELKPLVSPSPTDTRFPIDVFYVSVADGETQADVLSRLPTTIYPEDRVRFVVDPAFGLGSIVHVERAALVTVKDGKFTLQKRTFANTVEELLADIHRDLDPLDKATYKTTDLIQPGM